jgi:poly(3-hydroxybutyrate) depolymerase
MYNNIAQGKTPEAEKLKDFYDEYLAVMDLTAEFYIQTIDRVFVRHCLPEGTMMHRDKKVDPSAITRVALMTVEGENDDITGHGQTEASHGLCPNIPQERKLHYTQAGVGHYGVFSGSRFKSQIAPRVTEFLAGLK